ncbi:class I SAM-dependent methyltransferase [Kineobactrum salinum]|uniref:Class I SAM-dependent methyltransferase n=1 Tax=Kineobactrum salinum TaxID=2708301 RepID=A0A6C0U1Y4_9GAMM|nr:methyltransferase domain-containing protein [Kineobactrum salinum]QIB64375.1 class I SAM-dependent methyltransferase [Kineobactrum salinum]
MKYAVALLCALIVVPAQAALDWETALQGPQRSAENKARDDFRHPRETLEFFGLEEGMTVVELSPGGGWYTEVLAPLVVGNGKLYAAHLDPNGGAYARNSLGGYLQKLAADHELYGPVVVTRLQPPEETAIAPAGSADLVLAFRNVHSWLGQNALKETLEAAHRALKPGGVLGVVQHRASADAATDPETMGRTGYVSEDYLVEVATEAGFELAASSDINANPRDTADHPGGVWALPPVLRGGDQNREAMLAIGESDRMTLKFVKAE